MEKENLENKIEETIRILGNMTEEDMDFPNYQHILNFQSKQYAKLYGEPYVTKNSDF